MNITEREGFIQLNSTAVTTATSEMNGSVIECRSGIVETLFIGTTSFCVIGKLNKGINCICLITCLYR